MTLVEIRQWFVELSGRYDLVVDATDWEDQGADKYIRAGQDKLDRMLSFKAGPSRVMTSLSSGDFYALCQKARAIKEAWVTTATSRAQLTKKNLQDLLVMYPEPATAMDVGTPLYWSPMWLRKTPETSLVLTIDDFGGTRVTESVTEANRYTYNGVLFYPPSDGTHTLELVGLFYSETLAKDADISYWSSQHPEVLMWAALYILEVSYRNTSGARDWLAAIQDACMGIDMDLVEEELPDTDQAWG